MLNCNHVQNNRNHRNRNQANPQPGTTELTVTAELAEPVNGRTNRQVTRTATTKNQQPTGQTPEQPA
jgi:hypothetical protein